MKLTTYNGKEITLNDQQQEAVHMVMRWLKSPHLFCLLSGYAGTGKTTMVKYIQQANPDAFGRVLVTAPTHKAKQKIAQATGLDNETLQAVLGLGPDVSLENFDPNKPEFARVKDPKMHEYDTVLIDEGSMVNSALWETVVELAGEHRVRILVLMDVAQLPPVNEDHPPIHTSNHILDEFRVELTKVERQTGGNPLMPIYDYLRNNLTKANNSIYGRGTELNDKEEGIYVFRDAQAFGEHVLQFMYNDLSGETPGQVKLLAWQNATVKAWNKYFRDSFFGANSGLLLIGEVLMSYSNVRGKITNSAEYRVENLIQDTRNYSTEVLVGGKLKRLSCDTVNVLEARLMDIDMKTETVVDIVYPEDGMKLAIASLNFRKVAAANPKLWPKYFEWRAKFYLMDDVMNSYGDRVLLKKDLDYGYAMTVHKSQGSTYKHIFLDQRDLNMNRKVVERNKMTYVALSRPTNTASVLL